MGRWGEGLLDNDSAADAMHEIADDIYTRAVEHAGRKISPKEAGPLAAQLGLLAHYASWEFEQKPGNEGYERTRELHGLITAHRAVLLEVAPNAGPLLDRLLKRDVVDLPSVAPLLGAKHARAYLQDLGDAAVEELQETIEDDQGAAASLDLLALIAPYVEVSHRMVREWSSMGGPYLKACKKILLASTNGDSD